MFKDFNQNQEQQCYKKLQKLWNSSKFIDIYNMIIKLDTRDRISCE